MKYTKKMIMAVLCVLLVFSLNLYSFAASQEVIQEIQQRLNDLGYDCGTPDGISGAKTVGAIAQFQEDHGLEIVGQADEEFLEVLKTINGNGENTANNIEGSSGDESFDPNATVWTLKDGYYYAGIDIPAGKFDAKAISGTGNLYSSNLYNGGVNEMFGIDDGTGLYIDSFNGINLPVGEYLELSGGMVIEISYSTIDREASGRKYSEEKAFTLSSGNYTSGEAFTPGIYKIVAVSGNGNLSSSNLYDGGVNEMFGIDDGTGWYIDEFINVSLPEGETLEISGITVKMIPAIAETSEGTTREITETKEEIQPSASSDGVTPSWKEYWDKYEEFMNEYCDFLESYDEGDFSAMLEYFSLLEKYEEYMAEVDDVAEDDLSTADYNYYIEVMTRVNKRLAEIS